MSLPKLAAGGGAALVIASGGYGISTLFNKGMPDYSSISESAKKDKYVDSYFDYFVSAENNDPWWDWVYKERYSSKGQTSPGKMFEGVTSGSEGNNSIKVKCGDVYEKTNNEINTSDTAENSKYSEADIWRYCTAVNKKPTNIPSEGESEKYDNGTYGATNKGKLVAVNDASNDSFWQEQQRLFFKTEKKSNRSGAHAKGTSGTFFKDLWNAKKGSLKETCRLAYKELENATGADKKVHKEDLFKFCSLKGKE
ncbi:hypothetical protein MHSWG343_06680 [Candidatus Mycoplasma haematohominis]|uniref:Uncharacterized protein n=1 Tax=Candidatus Mycoplasma haematohominis TaxID=1494318 RepID=A0A478FQ67_9MOLU|nr:hypothetical protein MHSWG343_06680 [Candidatus Mycoplasma haemohominis]